MIIKLSKFFSMNPNPREGYGGGLTPEEEKGVQSSLSNIVSKNVGGENLTIMSEKIQERYESLDEHEKGLVDEFTQRAQKIETLTTQVNNLKRNIESGMTVQMPGIEMSGQAKVEHSMLDRRLQELAEASEEFENFKTFIGKDNHGKIQEYFNHIEKQKRTHNPNEEQASLN